VLAKVNLSHYNLWRCMGERRYSFYSFLTSALDAVSGQRYAPAALYPRYPLDRRLGGPQSWSGHRGQRKNPFPLPGIEPRQGVNAAINELLLTSVWFTVCFKNTNEEQDFRYLC
jgi:hypothetical protein